MVLIVQPEITKEVVEYIKNSPPPHRIHFATTHSEALKRNKGSSFIGSFSIPFSNTVEPFFNSVTGLDLFPNKADPVKKWRSIKDEDEFNIIAGFISKFKNLVFLKDALALSAAFDFNKIDNETHTKIGKLRKRTKFEGDLRAKEILVNRIPEKIKNIPFYCESDVICAVPSGRSFLKEIAGSVSKGLKISDVSDCIRWTDKRENIIDTPIDKKWEKLEESGLVVDADLTGKTVLLLDDLYQSGITMQYVAMKLQKAGAVRIYGLSIVKSLNDTDNV